MGKSLVQSVVTLCWFHGNAILWGKMRNYLSGLVAPTIRPVRIQEVARQQKTSMYVRWQSNDLDSLYRGRTDDR